jgi:glycosyltransferase involved in cell wall biosynthesis
MHVAVNAWFWNRPDTGSGQYTRRLVGALPPMGVHVTLIAPEGHIPDQTEGVDVLATSPRRGNLDKVRFEQTDFPRAAGESGAELAHVPYWGGPLRSPLPMVVTIHDLIPLLLPVYRGGFFVRLYTSLVAASARGAAAILTDSEASRRDILAHLELPPTSVHAVPLATDPVYKPEPDDVADAAVRQKYGLPPEYVLYLGGYDVRKNLPMLLCAYTYVKRGLGDRCPLVLAGRLPTGRSPRFTAVEPLLDAFDLRDVVCVIGEVDEADKPALYRGAACFVYPSRYEGFGLPPLEAMACGTPVVATDASSLPEVVGHAGFLVGPDDVQGAAGAIIAILTQDDLAGSLRQQGPAQAARFSWERTAQETLAVYRGCLAH